ncbi:MAG: Coq4 family protein [Myxococcota bacterium]
MGDAAAYKVAFLKTTPYPDVARALGKLEEPLPAISLTHLRRLERGTLGREYADHMDREHLQPLDLSQSVRDELAEHVLGLRYTLLHDLFHVLLSFDTSWAGELGVWQFVGAQKYCPEYERAARWAWRVYPVVAPRQLAAFRANSDRARALARRAPSLIAHDYRQCWERPLENVRSALALDDAP